MMETKDYKEGIREYDTYVFDLDGTLLSTLDDLAASCNYALRTNGMEEHSVDDVRRFVGNGVRKLMERAIPQGDSNPLFDKTYADFRKHYMEHNLDTTKPYPGIMDLLSRLKERNKKVAVVSNKFYAATQALCRHFFGDLVDVAIGERENIRKKPAPDTVGSPAPVGCRQGWRSVHWRQRRRHHDCPQLPNALYQRVMGFP